MRPFAHPAGGRSGQRYNDGKCDRRGRLWIGAMDMAAAPNRGHLYRVDPDGACHTMDSGFTVPNGLGFSPDGRTLYVAAYATHDDGRQRHMNIAFPVPGGHMTSILRVDAIPGGGVVVSTKRAGPSSDCGIYVVLGPLVIRSPLSEEIRVWLDDAGALVARHDVWLFGVRFLSLDYAMRASLSACAG